MISCSEGSHIIAAHDSSLTLTRKEIQITVKPEITSRKQQFIGNTNSFNLSNIVNFVSGGDDEGRVPNSPTSQVLEAGPGSPVLVDVHDWT